MTAKPLTPKQQAFVNEYLANGHNATAAYRLAYPASLTWKPHVVEVKAHELMKHGEVTVRIEQQTQALAKRNDLTADGNLQDLIRIADKAEAAEDYAVVHRIKVDLGRELFGQFPRESKHTLDVNHHNASLSAYTIEQLDALLAALPKPKELPIIDVEPDEVDTA